MHSDDAPGDPRACVSLDELRCADCQLGKFARNTAQFCPFIIRRYETGCELFSAGDPAEYVWLVMSGVVGLAYGEPEPGRVDELRLAGSTLGLRCAVLGQYSATARTLSTVTACGAPRRAYERWVSACERDSPANPNPEVTMLRLTRRITCPHSAHLETIQYTLDSNDTIAEIEACSSFDPCEAVDCNQLCKLRLNQKRRTERYLPDD